jgi:hypothetical protein
VAPTTTTCSSFDNQRQVQRRNVEPANTIYFFIFSFLKGYSISFKGIVVEKVLASFMLREYVPEYLCDLKKLKENQGVIENLKCG